VERIDLQEVDALELWVSAKIGDLASFNERDPKGVESLSERSVSFRARRAHEHDAGARVFVEGCDAIGLVFGPLDAESRQDARSTRRSSQTAEERDVVPGDYPLPPPENLDGRGESESFFAWAVCFDQSGRVLESLPESPSKPVDQPGLLYRKSSLIVRRVSKPNGERKGAAQPWRVDGAPDFSLFMATTPPRLEADVASLVKYRQAGSRTRSNAAAGPIGSAVALAVQPDATEGPPRAGILWGFYPLRDTADDLQVVFERLPQDVLQRLYAADFQANLRGIANRSDFLPQPLKLVPQLRELSICGRRAVARGCEAGNGQDVDPTG
jgi:hypothetical protein